MLLTAVFFFFCLLSFFFFKGLMLIPCLYLRTCMNINEIKRKRCAIFIRLDKHFWALVCSERGSLQAPALAHAAQAGEADVLNCQEDLPACLPATLKIAAPLLHTTLKTHLMCSPRVRLHFYARPVKKKIKKIKKKNSLPAFPPPLFIFTSYRLSNFYFLCDRSYNLKMQMCGLL